MALILIARDYFAVIYTDSKDLQQAVAKLAWLLGITMVLNSVQPVISGIKLCVNFLPHKSFDALQISILNPTCNEWSFNNLNLLMNCRSCCWRGMASSRGKYKFGFLLRIWAPSWIHSRLCSEFWSNGMKILFPYAIVGKFSFLLQLQVESDMRSFDNRAFGRA